MDTITIPKMNAGLIAQALEAHALELDRKPRLRAHMGRSNAPMRARWRKQATILRHEARNIYEQLQEMN